jgi:hypothetical protein
MRIRAGSLPSAFPAPVRLYTGLDERAGEPYRLKHEFVTRPLRGGVTHVLGIVMRGRLLSLTLSMSSRFPLRTRLIDSLITPAGNPRM